MTLDLVDVFGKIPFSGNPLAVVHGAQDWSDAQMLRLTQWLGFSETTFILPPGDPRADYCLRIFYPAGELPFAGHPTLGSAYCWLQAGGRPREQGRIVQQCGAGLVEIREEGDALFFEAPPLCQSGALSEQERDAAIAVAGVDRASVVEAVRLDNGPDWRVLRLSSLDALMNATPVAKAPQGTEVALVAPHPRGGDAQWELRAFFANHLGQIVEDPVTGSLNAGVALHLFGQGLAHGRYLAAQGQCVGADGLVDCRRDEDGRVWIGGRCAMIAHGAKIGAVASDLPGLDRGVER